MRKALLVGIDHYLHIKGLAGCVSDAYSMKAVLERHADGTVNFPTPLTLTGTGPSEPIEKSGLKDAIRELFKADSEIALFYFAGHGYIEDTGGYLCASDCKSGDDGLPLADVITFAQESPAKNKVIILDSCYGGIAGERPQTPKIAEVKQGMTILTASTADQYAMEGESGSPGGVFTNLFVDALGGAAANLLGHVTPGSVYAHIDQSLGPWAQRPVFKTNVESFVSLRKAKPPIELSVLQELATHFPQPEYEFPLDPSYEPERSKEQEEDLNLPAPDPVKNRVFKVLQQYVKVNLVRPIGVEHMWHAAMQSKSCELTVLGEHYRRLVSQGLI
jgi:hypothetical protein